MLIRSYNIHKDHSIKRVKSNIMATLNKRKSNEALLKAESTTKGKHVQSSSSNTSNTLHSSRSQEEKESKYRNKESIKSGSKMKNNNPQTAVSYCKTNQPNNMSNPTNSLPNYNHFNQLRYKVTPQHFRSFSETRVQHVNPTFLSLNSNKSSNNYNSFHVRRSTATEFTNSTQASLNDIKHAESLRTWEYVSYKKPKRTSSSVLFSIMNYNVLAQELLTEHSYLYRHHNTDALVWDQRWSVLFKEIKQHNADILCLQEVQTSHLNSHYSDLKGLGYDGIFKQRTGLRTDGCAIYYKPSIFNLIEYNTVEFNQSESSVLNRDNVAIIAKFSCVRNPESEFVVATTHLLYNPRREDVRLVQTQVLLSEIDRIAYKKNGSNHSHLPIILSGDFNLKPNSAIYELLVRGNLHYEHLTNRSLSRSNTTLSNATGKFLLTPALKITDECQHADLVVKRQENYNLNREDEVKLIQLQHTDRKPITKCSNSKNKSLFSTGTLSHHLALKSAYNHIRGNDLEATTYQDDWITVDYVFYSGIKDEYDLIKDDKLKLISRYTIPTRHQLQGLRIPNFAFGSDHLLLLVKFQLDP